MKAKHRFHFVKYLKSQVAFYYPCIKVLYLSISSLKEILTSMLCIKIPLVV